MPDSVYVLGHSESEVRRLELMGGLLAPGTERLLKAAGIAPGMSVLDLGTGAGDVAMQAAALVGPSGAVLGIDREPGVVERARERAADAGLTHVRYEAATLDTLPSEQTFDAVIGRFVIVHQPDRVAFLRQSAARVRAGGTIGIIEPAPVVLAIGHGHSAPPVALYDEVRELFVTAAGLADLDIATGMELVRLFREAGLPEPSLLHDVAIGGPGSPIVEFACLSLRSFMPVLERHGVTTAERLGLDDLQARIQTAASACQSQLIGPCLAGAWARVG